MVAAFEHLIYLANNLMMSKIKILISILIKIQGTLIILVMKKSYWAAPKKPT